MKTGDRSSRQVIFFFLYTFSLVTAMKANMQPSIKRFEGKLHLGLRSAMKSDPIELIVLIRDKLTDCFSQYTVTLQWNCPL